MSKEYVVLVNRDGEELGLMEKMEAHEKGVLHKAISVLIFNEKNEMLLQQRAYGKYHWPGIWSNACCTHPRENESYLAAAERRVVEELGITLTLEEKFNFIYKAVDQQSGLTEHELDTVFFGTYAGEIPFNPEEVNDVKWINIQDLLLDIEKRPEIYSFWFLVILKEMKNKGLI